MQREIQAVFNEEFAPAGKKWPMGTVGIIDESSFVKKGKESAGVQKQWCGRLGKKENCQVGVFLVGATPWRPNINGMCWKFPPTPRCGSRSRPDKRRTRTSAKSARSPRPCRSRHGKWLKLREGAKGPLVFGFARLRVWAVRHRHAGPPIWLLFRRSVDGKELQYYVSNADEKAPLKVMAQVSGCRWRVEEIFEDGKMHLGMADYEARSWTGWHHHMSLVALAHLFVTQTRRDAKSQIPDLTRDMALRIVRSAMERPQITFDDALDLIEYHRDRDRQAKKSHRKTWLEKHKRVWKKVML